MIKKAWCGRAVRGRNSAFRIPKRTQNYKHLVTESAQAVVRRTVRQVKRGGWQGFCNKIERTTPIGGVWK